MTCRAHTTPFAFAVLVSACASTTAYPPPAGAPAAQAGAPVTPAPESAGALPAVDSVVGPLALRVQYPAARAVIDARDSSFMFGSTGSGDATLTINGAPVRVAPNGAWLAWVALPPDSLMRFELVARTPRDSQRLVHEARRAPGFRPPASGPWIDSSSISPRGEVAWPRNEYLTVSARAAPGARLELRLADGSRIPFAPDTRPLDVAWGIRAFDRDTLNLARPVPSDRYVAVIRGRAIGVDSLGVDSLGAPRDSVGPPFIEAISGVDTVRAPWPIRLTLLDSLPHVVELDDDRARRGGTDSMTIGRALPGGTYHWFWPTGTRARATGRVNGNVRLLLAPGLEAWVPAEDAQPLPGNPAPRAIVGSLTLSPRADRAVLRIPVSDRAPYMIVESERSLEVTIYGGAGDVNWIRYGGSDSLVQTMAWAQTAQGVRLTVDLSEPVWGFRSRWDRGDLLIEIRRPPEIDADDPFEGRVILVDPGHPPLGATGPTGFTEAEANLAVALRLRDLLEEAGARVHMVRTTDSAVDLGARPRLADAIGAELLVSIHNNALPDGVNPFPNNGTSVFYNHPRSIPLAMAVQRALVRRLGLRDLGVGRGDLALVRPTWMPAILTEGLFMMVPEQEAALRTAEGQQLYARGVFEGMRDYLRSRASRR